LDAEEQTIIEDVNLAISPVLVENQTRHGKSPTAESIGEKLQATMSKFYSNERLAMLSPSQLEALEKVVYFFSASTLNVLDPDRRPQGISLPHPGTHISSIQALVTKTRFGHGKPWKGMTKTNDSLTTKDMAESSGTRSIFHIF
jgi:hypothetical protein